MKKNKVIFGEWREISEEDVKNIVEKGLTKLDGFRVLETRNTTGVEITLPKDTKIIYGLPKSDEIK